MMLSFRCRPLAAAIALTLVGAACTKAPLEPTAGVGASIDQFTIALEVQGSVPYTFSLLQTTNVAITLASIVDAAGSASKAVVALALGTTDGTTCTPVTSVSTTSALKAQIVTTLNPGTYCVNLTDIGNLSDTLKIVGRIVQNPPIPFASSTTSTVTYTSNLAAGGSASRTFYANQPGSVAVTLQSLTPASVVGLAIGVPGLDGTGCNLSTVVRTTAGSSAQLTLPVDTSPYCVRIFDVGGLVTGPNGLATFTISIVHP